jgi:glycosyltransferase involved in cell wall biosynthesis
MPAYNEAPRVANTVRETRRYVDEVVVVDDGSVDCTTEEAEKAGARVVRQKNQGYIAAIKRGFREVRGEIVVTMDADGEHRGEDIPRLVKPIIEGEADLVLGVRGYIARPSERLLNWLTNLKVGVSDSGTGFRALRRKLALELELDGCCICGISVLEPAAMGARIAEVPIEPKEVDKVRSIAWFHLGQMWYVLRWIIR